MKIWSRIGGYRTIIPARGHVYRFILGSVYFHFATPTRLQNFEVLLPVTKAYSSQIEPHPRTTKPWLAKNVKNRFTNSFDNCTKRTRVSTKPECYISMPQSNVDGQSLCAKLLLGADMSAQANSRFFFRWHSRALDPLQHSKDTTEQIWRYRVRAFVSTYNICSA